MLLPYVKNCVCGKVHTEATEFKVSQDDNVTIIWFDCECKSTLICKFKDEYGDNKGWEPSVSVGIG